MKTILYLFITILLLLCNWSAYSQQPFMVKDIYPGTNSSLSLFTPTKNNTTLFFMANDLVNGSELWKSDGTNAGTVMVKDIYPGYMFAGVPNSSTPRNLTDVNGLLYFTADNGINGNELWKSDGTEAGTVMVKDINIYSNFSDGSSDAAMLTNINGVLYFRCNNIDNGYELWKSDGTAIGTVMVKDIFIGSSLNGLPNSSAPYSLTNVNGTLFFSARDQSTSNFELWKSDGTSAGTVKVKEIVAGNNGSDPIGLANVNGTLYFSANDGINGIELWKSDGTNAGTVMVKDIFPGYNAQNNYFYNSSPNNLTNVNGTLFFSACDSEIDSNRQNFELWKTDGTAVGTVKVKEIRNGTVSSFLNGLTNANGTLYFVANDGINGKEVWKSDGTEAGTTLLKDLYAGVIGSEPFEFTYINGTIYFVANDGITGRQIFKTDGTANGTTGVNILNLIGDPPSNLINVNGKLFFTARIGVYGTELWVLDTNLLATLKNTIMESKFSIFPNPVKDILTIQNSDSRSFEKVIISDLTGKKVLEQNSGSNTINLEKLQNGMYLLQIISDGKSTVSKFIKN
ncbi:T9SS type A sorting domain-containing protein [Flavobacterium franklandianum]|uniref:ELWxxDGT repeat protein n=1 Tax=Flavobacterium franklandianum TaxID=2594430 RepID=UPI001179B57D|nr:ELWxxDGT repeat protein [Flavobacterium franklandianum]TRX25223.1 T9SS type A sorting domain-containing protein [Flavobacterium franklandianum]